MDREIRIMLVDDNEDDLILIDEAFSDAPGMSIRSRAMDGQEAMEYLEQCKAMGKDALPDIVLLDINMPRKNGFEVLKDIKADRLIRRIPVVILTTSDNQEDIARSYAGGASSYIKKPIDYDDFKRVTDYFAKYWNDVAELP